MENNSLVENDDGESLLIFLMGFILFACALVVVFMLIIKTRNGSGDGESDGTGDGTGAPADDGSRSPAVIQALATLPPDDGMTSLGIFLSLLGPLVLGIATSAVPGLVIAAIRRLTDSSKTLIKSEIKALQSFKSATRPKFSARAIARSTKKLLTQKLGSLGLAARVRLGMIWGKALTRIGYTAAEMTQVLARRLGQAAAERIAAQIAARVAARVATASTHGPLMVFELAITAISLGLDLSNTGGWSNIDGTKTSDLLQQRAILEADLKNAYIGGFKDDNGVVDPSTAVGFYPLYWGPLDEMDDTVNSDGIDFFDVMIETKMFEMLMADNPDPFIVKLLGNVARQYGVTSTDINDLFSASLLTDMTTTDYEDLYDRAFDSICIDNGGVLVDTGLAGRPKQCSHANETSCHAKSPWIEGEGIATTDAENTTYTEWRERDFFNKNYSPANVPDGATGACIVADPTFHEMCSTESICMDRAQGVDCGKNQYIRNRGVCTNTQELCRKAGVSYCADMRQRGGSGGNCPTTLDGGRQSDLGDYASILLPGETLPGCYQNTGDQWAEFFLGSTMYRYFNSGAAAQDTLALLQGQTGNQGVDNLVTGVVGGDYGLGSIQLANQQAALIMQGAGATNCVLYNNGLWDGRTCYKCPGNWPIPTPVYGPVNSQGSMPLTGYNCTVPAAGPTTPTTPTTCPAGQYLSGTTCTNCPVDTYKTGTGTSINDCINCDTTKGFSGQSSCEADTYCPTGTIVSGNTYTCATPKPTTCPPGQYRYGHACFECDPNTYKAGTGTSIRDCIPCAGAARGSAACGEWYKSSMKYPIGIYIPSALGKSTTITGAKTVVSANQGSDPIIGFTCETGDSSCAEDASGRCWFIQNSKTPLPAPTRPHPTGCTWLKNGINPGG
jgi:hypothetical protein